MGRIHIHPLSIQKVSHKINKHNEGIGVLIQSQDKQFHPVGPYRSAFFNRFNTKAKTNKIVARVELNTTPDMFSRIIFLKSFCCDYMNKTMISTYQCLDRQKTRNSRDSRYNRYTKIIFTIHNTSPQLQYLTTWRRRRRMSSGALVDFRNVSHSFSPS